MEVKWAKAEEELRVVCIEMIHRIRRNKSAERGGIHDLK